MNKRQRKKALKKPYKKFILVSKSPDTIFREFMDEQVKNGSVNIPGYFDDPKIRESCTKVKWENIRAKIIAEDIMSEVESKWPLIAAGSQQAFISWA